MTLTYAGTLPTCLLLLHAPQTVRVTICIQDHMEPYLVWQFEYYHEDCAARSLMCCGACWLAANMCCKEPATAASLKCVFDFLIQYARCRCVGTL